jgi:cysteine desulfurase family protein
MPARIYLDNAATSFPKPEAVYAAMDHYNRQVGMAVGRGSSRAAGEVQRVVDRCRTQVAHLLGATAPDRVVFTFNGTDSLNLGIHGLLRPGDHVVTSSIEHNSVLRPLRKLERDHGISLTCVAPDPDGRIEPAAVRAAIRGNTRLIVMLHASNVTGIIQPVEDIGQIARDLGVFFLLDAAQTAGHLPINLSQLPVDLLACPGHKGLLGPLGTGVLCLGPDLEHSLSETRQGGTGSNSADEHQPATLPDKYESGNHNGPGLYGLEAGLRFLEDRTLEAIMAAEQRLTSQLVQGLKQINGIGIPGPPADQRVGVVSCVIEGLDPHECATILDEEFGIQTRAGLHCAPGIHRLHRTFEAGGSLRLSVGAFNTGEDIAATTEAIANISDGL